MIELPAVYKEKWRVARKPHTCCECGHEIKPGDTYRCLSGVWDGRGATFHRCVVCQALWDEWVIDDSEVAIGQLHEVVEAEWEDFNEVWRAKRAEIGKAAGDE